MYVTGAGLKPFYIRFPDRRSHSSITLAFPSPLVSRAPIRCSRLPPADVGRFLHLLFSVLFLTPPTLPCSTLDRTQSAGRWETSLLQLAGPQSRLRQETNKTETIVFSFDRGGSYRTDCRSQRVDPMLAKGFRQLPASVGIHVPTTSAGPSERQRSDRYAIPSINRPSDNKVSSAEPSTGQARPCSQRPNPYMSTSSARIASLPNPSSQLVTSFLRGAAALIVLLLVFGVCRRVGGPACLRSARVLPCSRAAIVTVLSHTCLMASFTAQLCTLIVWRWGSTIRFQPDPKRSGLRRGFTGREAVRLPPSATAGRARPFPHHGVHWPVGYCTVGRRVLFRCWTLAASIAVPVSRAAPSPSCPLSSGCSDTRVLTRLNAKLWPEPRNPTIDATSRGWFVMGPAGYKAHRVSVSRWPRLASIATIGAPILLHRQGAADDTASTPTNTTPRT